MEERLYPALITEALRNVRYPGNGKDLVENNMVEDDIRIDGMKVSFSLIFEKSTDPFVKSVVKAAETAVKTYASENAQIDGNISVKFRQKVEQPAKMLPGVRNIIGERRCRQIHGGKQSCRRTRPTGLQGRSARRRYFRTVGTEDVRC